MNRIFPLAILLLLTTPAFSQKITGNSPSATLQPSKSIYQKVSLQLPATAGADEVKAAILEMKPLVHALGCDLHLRDVIESPGGWHYNFEQTWQGVPLYLGEIKATLTKSMRFMSLMNNLQSFSATPSAHTRSAAQVSAQLPGLLDEGYPDFHIVSNDLRYLLHEDALIPCHRVIYTSNTMSWELLLADNDLHELLRRDLAAYRKPICEMPLDTPGHSKIFIPDPLTSSGSSYGGGYVDASDADSPQLTAARIEVVLRDLTWNGSQFLLTGPYINLVDVEAPTGAPSTTSDGNFEFTRSQQGFEDAMVYYHIDTMQRYIQRLGFTNLRNGPLKADSHGLNGQDNSHFVSAGIDSRLGFGEGGVDDAEDADVITHEYGHALSDAGSPGSNSGTERQGLDEGIGDYMAASYSLGLSYTFWKNTFTWDGHNPFWPGRSASNPTLYPPSSPDIYTYGEIWASVLMEVYLQIGKEASDKVVLQSLYGNAPFSLLSDAAQVIFDADTLLYNGAHHDQYQQAFCARGILAGTLPGQDCFVGITDGQSERGLEWALYPNPATALARIEIKGDGSQSDLTYRLLDMMGRELRNAKVQGLEADIDLHDLAPSFYWVQLQAGNGWSETRRLMVE